MEPLVIKKGSASREVGDGTIITGGRGISIQVKSRDATTHDQIREARWVLKKAAEGANQAHGTIRLLRSGPIDLVNGRGRKIRCNAAELDWVGVVIIDHPSPPEVEPECPAANDLPIVVLLRRDWDFLFDQLRSVSAVVDYIHRISRQETRILGHESIRYYELAQADEDAGTQGSPNWGVDLGGLSISYPTLPKAPANSTDSVGHSVFRMILEDIAEAKIDRDELDRLETLASIDRFSIGERARLGRLLLAHLDDVMQVPTATTKWHFRRIIQDEGSLHLAFGVCSQFTELHREAFRQWTILRHQELTGTGIVPEGRTPKTVAVLLTPRHDGYSPWDTTMIAINGELSLEPDELAAMRDFWAQRN